MSTTATATPARAADAPDFWAEHMVCGYCHATILRADYFGSHGRTCHGLTGPIDLDAMLQEIGFDPSSVSPRLTRGEARARASAVSRRVALHYEASTLYDALRAAYYAAPDDSPRERRLLRAMRRAMTRELRRARATETPT